MLVCLGDMPFVTSDLLDQVLARATDEVASAATDGQIRCPPACFPKKYYSDLSNLTSDAGARDILRALPEAALVHTSAAELVDVDTRDDLSRYSRLPI